MRAGSDRPLEIASLRAGVAMICLLGACQFNGGAVPEHAPGTDGGSIAEPDAADLPTSDSGPEPDGALDGAPPIELLDDGLIVRYFLDEAAAGDTPNEVADAAGEPLPLSVTYEGDLSFTEIAGNRGLRFARAGRDDRASVPIEDTKIESALQDTTQATIELVVELADAEAQGSRLSHIGSGTESGLLTLQATDTSSVRFAWQRDTIAGEWTVDFESSGRVVLHAVLDTSAAAGERVRLYVDGSPVERIDEHEIPEGASLDLGDTEDVYYVLGNRENGNRTPEGVIYYAAMYASALSAADVAQNTTALADDDQPPSFAP